MSKECSLITVIVPIYNVEQFLVKCLDSIIDQDYPNLEIILINDGSQDNSGMICDQYQKKFTNIKVIHKENGGLSSARNCGLEIAKGEYISFIDSDDWIERDMITVLYQDLINNNADISCIAFYDAFADGTLKVRVREKQKRVFTNEEALRLFLFDGYLTPCVCGKLWKKTLWNTIRFPEGKLFEDQFTTYKLIDMASKIVFNPIPKYFYFKRLGSIGHSKFTKKTYDLYDAINEEYTYIVGRYPNLLLDLSVAKLTWEIVFINMMIINNIIDKKILKSTIDFSKNNFRFVLGCHLISKTRILQIFLFTYLYPIYRVLYIKYKEQVKPLS